MKAHRKKPTKRARVAALVDGQLIDLGTHRRPHRGKQLWNVTGAQPLRRADRKARRTGGRSENELGSADAMRLAQRQAHFNSGKAADTARHAHRLLRQGRARGGGV